MSHSLRAQENRRTRAKLCAKNNRIIRNSRGRWGRRETITPDFLLTMKLMAQKFFLRGKLAQGGKLDASH